MIRNGDARGWSAPAILPAALCIALVTASLAVHSPVAGETSTGTARETPPRFVGSQSCSQCHAQEHQDWARSHHAAAMQKADERTVLGRFDGSTFAQDNFVATFFRANGAFWVNTEGADGKYADFEVLYTFGITPLQQYLIALPGGRLQAFGVAWDTRPASEGGQRWFHLYPGHKPSPGDPLHWTGIDQNWNYQCAWCHSTDLRKNYDEKSRTFDTTWSEISVGCEACHGPASNHISWTEDPERERSQPPGKGFDLSFDERRGVSWSKSDTGRAVRSEPRATSKEIGACAGCHSRRSQFSDTPLAAGRYFDAFRASRLEPGLYHPDGQQRDEVYSYGSFIQSRMHATGVTCSDCHDPHSGKLRSAGNAVCSQCHAADSYDTTAHHRHASGSTGAQCVNCHMPASVYMGVDARHDHSMRIPRPDRTRVLGTPNACGQCHRDQTAQWASASIKQWFPSPNPGAQTFSEAFDLGDRGAPGAQSALIRVAEDNSLSGIVRASAIARLGRFPSRQVIAVLARALAVNDPDVRTAAIAALSSADPATRLALLVPLLRDRHRIVRMDAARELAGDSEASLSPEDRGHFEQSLAEYVAAQHFNAERPESHANLGELYLRRGQTEQARAAFREALALDRTFYAAAVTLAELERRQGDEAAAEAILRQSLETNPSAGALMHALGLSLVRQKRMPEALEALARATKSAPEDPRLAHVYAVALNGMGRRADAIAVLKSAIARHHYDRDLLLALMSYEIDARDFSSAVSRAELLSQLEPERSDIEQLSMRLRQRVK